MAKKCPREGTRVRYAPNPISHALYAPGMRRASGDTGEVTSLPVGGKKSTCMPGPGGGLVYVKWDDGSTVGVSPVDLAKEKGGKKSLGFIGPDGKDALKKYGKCARKCRTEEPLDVSGCIDRCIGTQASGFVGLKETEAYEIGDIRSGITFGAHDGDGVCGWPLVPSTHFPGEKTLACPKCGGTNITMGMQPGGTGTGPGRRWRMGDPGGSEFVRCDICGEKCVYKSKSIGAYQFPSTE